MIKKKPKKNKTIPRHTGLCEKLMFGVMLLLLAESQCFNVSDAKIFLSSFKFMWYISYAKGNTYTVYLNLDLIDIKYLGLLTY